jgi:hypothetical protein
LLRQHSGGSGVAFGPKGTKWENALAVSDNGANDVGHRRVANGAEKLWIVTEKGQDGGFPDKEGMNFVSNKRFSMLPYPKLSSDRHRKRLQSFEPAGHESSPCCIAIA